MIKELTAGGANTALALVSLFFFITFFVVMVVRVFRRDDAEMNTLSHLPLGDDDSVDSDRRTD